MKCCSEEEEGGEGGELRELWQLWALTEGNLKGTRKGPEGKPNGTRREAEAPEQRTFGQGGTLTPFRFFLPCGRVASGFITFSRVMAYSIDHLDQVEQQQLC